MPTLRSSTDATRSRIMRSIRSKDTKPEILIRRALHAEGFRFRIHYKKLVGKPDIVLPKYGAIVLVNGCFWHGHDCHIFRPPRDKGWQQKIANNKKRDAANLATYKKAGWRVLEIWECALQGKTKKPMAKLTQEITAWLTAGRRSRAIRGKTAKRPPDARS